MSDLANKAAGFFVVPVVAAGLTGLALPQPAMALPPVAPNRPLIGMQKTTAYSLAAVAMLAYALSRSRSLERGTASVATGAAMGSGIAAVLAYLAAVRTERAAATSATGPRPEEGAFGVLSPAGAAGAGAMPPLERPMVLSAQAGEPAVFTPNLRAVVPVDPERPRILRGSAVAATGDELAGFAPAPAAVREEVLAKLAALDARYQAWRAAQPDRDALPTSLRVVSHDRSFDEQAAIIAAQLRQLGATAASTDAELRTMLVRILGTRSMPGHSRHHWGTDVDVVSTDSERWRSYPPLARVQAFLEATGPELGFYTPYRDGAFPEPAKPHYNAEPWHLSYFPLAADRVRRWTAVVKPAHAQLLDRVASHVAPDAGVDQAALRRALGDIDLPSFVTNVAPPPDMMPAPAAVAAPAPVAAAPAPVPPPALAFQPNAAIWRNGAQVLARPPQNANDLLALLDRHVAVFSGGELVQATGETTPQGTWARVIWRTPDGLVFDGWVDPSVLVRSAGAPA